MKQIHELINVVCRRCLIFYLFFVMSYSLIDCIKARVLSLSEYNIFYMDKWEFILKLFQFKPLALSQGPILLKPIWNGRQHYNAGNYLCRTYPAQSLTNSKSSMNNSFFYSFRKLSLLFSCLNILTSIVKHPILMLKCDSTKSAQN